MSYRLFDSNGLDVTTGPFTAANGDVYLHGWQAVFADDQLAEHGITRVVEPPPPPPEPPSLESQKIMVEAMIDSEVDGVYQRVIGNRQPEYSEAEKQAHAYKDAGYTGAVPAYVASWVAASGKTATAATDDILTQAAAWRAAAGAMRAARLAHKAQAQVATTQAALDAVRASWATSIGQIRAALGL